ncbi:cyclic AMP-responsive element-binding protein 5 [Brachionichthys hirsutus]|uniref:cyclic AMP-responsive element-binding protein 5 n=1 Tax=Brachionichthys hirsutus TaxID=412623 RepID=UPI0036052B75
MQRLVHAPLQFYEKVARVMNSDQERPFVCNAHGCSQRFPTEDHLMIHRHKHEMTLKFPSIKNDNMLSDQTPTPTRFLKNCEEVGLFSELDCSIEQEYCKAQGEDSKQSIALHGQAGQGQHQHSHSRMSNHDTSIVIQQALPSPQSNSVITQAPSTNRQIGCVMFFYVTELQMTASGLSSPLCVCTESHPSVFSKMERQMSMGSNMMGMQGPTHSSSCSSTHIPTMHSEAKLRLKAALSHHPGAIANGNMNSMGHMMEMMSSRQEQGAHHHMHSHPHQHLQAPPHAYQHHGHHHHGQGHGQGGHHHPQGHNPHHNSHNPHLHPGHPHQTSPHPPMHSSSHMSPASQQIQPTQTLQSPPPSGRRRRVVDEDPDERRRKFLERNRAAATRCRQKRKVWVISLEKKAEELTQTNMQLQNEVTMLKNEVTQLKQLLLTHKDCPITTMQKESQGYLSPESSPAGSPTSVCSQQQVIQHNTITTSTTTVGGSSVHGQANHRTDINPIH